LKTLKVEDEEPIEVYEVADVYARDNTQYVSAICGKVFEHAEINSEYKNISKGDYLMLELSGDVGHEKADKFEALVPTLEYLKINYSFS
jgi:hypothetical protein